MVVKAAITPYGTDSNKRGDWLLVTTSWGSATLPHVYSFRYIF